MPYDIKSLPEINLVNRKLLILDTVQRQTKKNEVSNVIAVQNNGTKIKEIRH
jgi:hypothetical protein